MLAEHDLAIDDTAGDRRPEHERRRVVGVVAVADAERAQPCGRRTGLGVGGAERRLGFLHFARRDDPLGGERALALERLRGDVAARVGDEAFGARAPQLRAPQARQRRARAHLGVELGEDLQHLAIGGGRHLRVPGLVGRQLPEHRDLLGSGTLGHGRGADAQVAHHVLAQMDGVFFFLVRVRGRRLRGRRGAARLRGAVARGREAERAEQRKDKAGGHRSTPAMKSIVTRRWAASRRRSITAVRTCSASRRIAR